MDKTIAGLSFGAQACIGEWRNRAKAITISERDGGLVLEMGANSPTLTLQHVASKGSDDTDVWPMRWTAIRALSTTGGVADTKDILYSLELPSPISPKLFVKRPVGEGVVEFHRSTDTSSMPLSNRVSAESRSRSHSRSQSRAASQKAGKEGHSSSAGPVKMLPGDWTCGKCHFHNFARNPSCRGCGAPKPRVDGDDDATARKREPKGREDMIMQIKRGQRESNAFKERWWGHCDKHGNGFYDPVRHETKFLEDFCRRELGPRSRTRSSSSRSSKESASSQSRSRSSSARSRSRTRSLPREKRKKKNRRKRSERRKRRHRRRRKERSSKQQKKRSRSLSSSAGSSGSRNVLAVLEKTVAEAEKMLERTQKDKSARVAALLREATEDQQKEVARRVAQAHAVIEEEIKAKLREADAKLQDEKKDRMREAEQKLDNAISTRLAEAETKLRKEAEVRIEEARRAAVDACREEYVELERSVRETVAESVKIAEEKLKDAKARASTARAGKRRRRKDKGREENHAEASDSGPDEMPHGTASSGSRTSCETSTRSGSGERSSSKPRNGKR